MDIKNIIWGWLLIVGVWFFCSYLLHVPLYLLASPGQCLACFMSNYDLIINSFVLTISQAICGLVISVVAGVFIGALSHYFQIVKSVILSPVVALQTVPVIALAPLLTFWLGYGFFSKSIVTAITAIFPIIFSTLSGIDSTPLNYIYIYKHCSQSFWKIFFQVQFPSARYSLIGGIQSAAALAVVGSIISDFIGGDSGLGFLIMKSVYSSRSELLLVATFLSALAGQMFVVGARFFSSHLFKDCGCV